MTDPKVTRRRRMAAQRLDAAHKALHRASVDIGVAAHLLTGTGDGPDYEVQNQRDALAAMRRQIATLIGNAHIMERAIQMKRDARGK